MAGRERDKEFLGGVGCLKGNWRDSWGMMLRRKLPSVHVSRPRGKAHSRNAGEPPLTEPHHIRNIKVEYSNIEYMTTLKVTAMAVR